MSDEPSAADTRAGPPPLPPPRRMPWRRILFGAVILVCGVAIGAGAGTIATKRTAHERMQRWWRDPARAHEWMSKRIAEELQLSPRQSEQVTVIVKDRMGQVGRIIDERRPLIDAQFSAMKQEVAGVLKPEQARVWEERNDSLLRGRRSSHRRDREGDRDKDGARETDGQRDASERSGDKPGGDEANTSTDDGEHSHRTDKDRASEPEQAGAPKEAPALSP